MKINSLQTHTNEMYRLQDSKRMEKEHTERMQEEIRIKENRKVDEARRVEMNRKLNRPTGQRVDTLA
jgi:ribonuclease HII